MPLPSGRRTTLRIIRGLFPWTGEGMLLYKNLWENPGDSNGPRGRRILCDGGFDPYGSLEG